MNLFVYPRLSHHTAESVIGDVTHAMNRKGLAGVAELAATRHPKAAPVATGGRVASDGKLQEVRDEVLNAIEPWMDKASVPRNETAAFDRALGRTLHGSLEIVPSDASHETTWNFLSLILLPDVVVLRFPEMHRDRLLGKPRNPLRAAWMRRDVLGDLMDQGPNPLGVDELVGLFERTAMARNRELLRVLAREILSYSGPTGRSDWARELLRETMYSTGPLLLDGLSEEQLQGWLRSDVSSRIRSAS